MNQSRKHSYKLRLSYKGTRYHGWQFQTSESETIQGHLEKVLAKITRHEDFQVIGASRTDSGVHAWGQTLKVTLPKKVLPENLMRGMNTKLPNDIKVVSCEFVNEKFNVNLHAKSKEYHYYFTINKGESALLSETVTSVRERLDLALMKKACEQIIGEQNFLSFSVPGSKSGSTQKKILGCSIEKTKFLSLEDEVYYLKIQGTGFLKYMIRFIMGALWDIGMNKLSLEDFSLSLKTGEEHGIRNKAPAQGLHLIHIEY